jgi:hypothetical protein
VPVPGKKSGVGGAVVAILIVVALALGGKHLHLASSGQGGGGVVPHAVAGASPADPCHNQPDSKVVREIRAPGRKITLDCAAWRDIIRRAHRQGAPRLGTVRQILRCVTVTLQRGSWRELNNGERASWQWGSEQDDVALVLVEAGRVSFATPGYAFKAWSACAKAAELKRVRAAPERAALARTGFGFQPYRPATGLA